MTDSDFFKKKKLDSRKIFSQISSAVHQVKPPEQLPTSFVGTYQSDVNILEIDQAILQKFTTDQQPLLAQLRLQLQFEQKQILQPQRVIDRRHSLAQISTYQSKISNLETNFDRITYQTAVESLLEKYRKMGPRIKIITFGDRKIDEESAEISSHRLQIVERYLYIARNYIEIDLTRIVELSPICPGCLIRFDDLLPDDNGLKYCQCGIEFQVLQNLSMAEENPTGSATRSDYESKLNFMKGFQRKQGRQNVIIPPEVFSKLDSYFASNNMKSGSEIQQSPLLPDGSKAGTSLSMMREALTDEKLSPYYDDEDLICQMYWGWKLMDLETIQTQISDDYDKIEEKIRALPLSSKDKKIHIQYKLYQLIYRYQPHGINLFKMVETEDILQRYDYVWGLACEQLGWIYQRTN